MKDKEVAKKAKRVVKTRKKVKVVGTKEFIDADTGEVHTMNVVSIEERE